MARVAIGCLDNGVDRAFAQGEEIRRHAVAGVSGKTGHLAPARHLADGAFVEPELKGRAGGLKPEARIPVVAAAKPGDGGAALAGAAELLAQERGHVALAEMVGARRDLSDADNRHLAAGDAQRHRVGADAGGDAAVHAHERMRGHGLVGVGVEDVREERLEAGVLRVVAQKHGVEEVQQFGAVASPREVDVDVAHGRQCSRARPPRQADGASRRVPAACPVPRTGTPPEQIEIETLLYFMNK